MPIHPVRIDPVDPLLFGDSRSARAGLDHLQLDQDPSPLTLHGALGKHVLDLCGGDWPCEPLGDRQKDVLSPEGAMARLLGFGYRLPGGALLFPRPRHLRCRPGLSGEPQPFDLLAPADPGDRAHTSSGHSQLLLEPRPPGGAAAAGASDDEIDEIDEYEGDVWLQERVLEPVLCGRVPETATGSYAESAVFRSEMRPGIAVDNRSGTVFEGQLFTRPYRRFAPLAPLDPRHDSTGAGFYAWFETAAPLPVGAGGFAFLGGDRRRVRLTFEDPVGERTDLLPDLLAAVARTADTETTRGFCLALLTPALLEKGDDFAVGGHPPVAGAVGKPGHASGWDAAKNHPRDLVRLVPPGSVYFYEWPSDDGRGDLVRRLWLEPIQARGGAVGFGRCLVGVWR